MTEPNITEEILITPMPPKAIAALRQSYTMLAFAFNRLHESARSRDGELCRDFAKVRAQIEILFREEGIKL